MTRSQRPNVVVVLADDLGFSDIGCYGGEIETPNLDRLRRGGALLSAFHNTARCTPSRASLLTGLHPHQVGIGILTGDDSPVGYRGSLDHAGATIAELLSTAGYRTGLSGKWHLSASLWEPDEAWPTRRGFDSVYATIAGCGSFYQPATLVRGETPVPREPADDPDYYYTDAITAEALRFLADTGDDPFFLYVAYTAPHWPLHAPDDIVAKYLDRYRAGWDALRDARLDRQRASGLLAEAARLSPRDERVPAWESTPDQDWQARRMAVYAAQVEIMDTGIGRILDRLDESGQAENTIVVFLSDNGASPENVPTIPGFETHEEFFSPLTKDGRPVRLGNSPDIVPGGPESYASYGPEWANLSNTPFRLYKKWIHEGGIAAPFLIRWPGRIPEGSTVRRPSYLVDVVPTLLAATGVPYPDQLDGRPILPAEGVSLLADLRGESPTAEDRDLCWEHCGNAAVRRGDWKLVRRYGHPWELYDLTADPTELVDLVAERRELAESMYAAWCGWASRVGVIPFERIVELFELRGGSEIDAAR
jgi:arylsulfatase